MESGNPQAVLAIWKTQNFIDKPVKMKGDFDFLNFLFL